MKKTPTPGQLLKKELKKEFPGVKFSVRFCLFSGGSSIDVDRTDGPSENSVNKIASNFSLGNFNLMEDIYEYKDNANSEIQAKYISLNRGLSNEDVVGYIEECGDLGKDEIRLYNRRKLFRFLKEVDL